MEDSPDRAVSTSAIMASFRTSKVENWISVGYIPRSKYAEGWRRYPGDFVELVLKVSKGEVPTLTQIRFCSLVWRAELGSEEERREARLRLQELRKKKRVYLVADAAPVFGYPRRNVTRWIEHGVITGVKAGGIYYILAEEIEYVAKILNGYTVYEAADVLGVSLQVVINLRKRGVLSGVILSQRIGIRFDPEEVMRVKEMREAQKERTKGLIDDNTAARMLGIHPDTLVKWERASVLTAVRIGGRRFHEVPAIERLKKLRSTLSDGFEWLELDASTLCFSHKQAARFLGVTVATLVDWIKKGVPLPYFNLTPPPVQLPERQFPQFYILELVKFAGGAPVSIHDARMFYEHYLQKHQSKA